ncbi:MAG: YtxH domain-containing protein [Magnetococcales bacterium]|nr:YtxH domain-containing protein [Magnetococcales bacterium]
MHHHHYNGQYPMGGPAWHQPQGAWVPPGPPAPQGGHNGDADRRFVKGVLLGAAAAYLLTNDKVQHTLFRAVAKVWTGVRFGLEEVKERYQDAQAEVESERRG